MRNLILLVVAGALSACGSTVVQLRNPDTGLVIQCQDENLTQIQQGTSESCARYFESQGYQRIPN